MAGEESKEPGNDGLLFCVRIIVKAGEYREANPEGSLSAGNCIDSAIESMGMNPDEVNPQVHDALCAAVLCDWFTPIMALRQIQKMISMAEAQVKNAAKAEEEASEESEAAEDPDKPEPEEMH